MNEDAKLWFTECSTCSSTCTLEVSVDAVHHFTDENEWPASSCCNAPVIFVQAD